MELMVLLIVHYLIRKILLEKVLDVHVRDVKIKFLDPNIVNASSMKKVHGKIFVLICTERVICSLQDHIEMMVVSTFSSSNVHKL
jgi:hypothetical protein